MITNHNVRCFATERAVNFAAFNAARLCMLLPLKLYNFLILEVECCKSAFLKVLVRLRR